MSFTYATETIAPEACMREYHLQSELGRGVSGTVWSACSDSKCPYAVKVQILRPTGSILPSTVISGGQFYFFTPTHDDFEQEVNYSFIASELEVGPHVYTAWTCDQDVDVAGYVGYILGFIAMDRINIDLSTWARANPSLFFQYQNYIFERLHEKYLKLLRHGIADHDLHGRNVGLKFDPNTGALIDVYILDYGPGTINFYPDLALIPPYEFEYIETAVENLRTNLTSEISILLQAQRM